MPPAEYPTFPFNHIILLGASVWVELGFWADRRKGGIGKIYSSWWYPLPGLEKRYHNLFKFISVHSTVPARILL